MSSGAHLTSLHRLHTFKHVNWARQKAAWHCGETSRRQPNLLPTIRTPHRKVLSRRSAQVAKQQK
ncbi:unnamed protein product [Ectocarpus sp. CCAP 1310/34]|nr:unnamed protein product [Ectocarpus sp. CCAP 1310/34]